MENADTCATMEGSAGENVALFPELGDCGLKDDLCYLDAALSWYDGSPAHDDVRGAWKRVTTQLLDVRADYLRLLGDAILAEAKQGRTG